MRLSVSKLIINMEAALKNILPRSLYNGFLICINYLNKIRIRPWRNFLRKCASLCKTNKYQSC